jgi:hypothetical protein
MIDRDIKLAPLSPSSEKEIAEIKQINDWKFRQSGKQQWYKATVPGTNFSDLYQNNLIEDPFYRDNESKLQWIEKEDWVYTAIFQVSQSELQDNKIELVFDGLDTYADISVNGHNMGQFRVLLGDKILDANRKISATTAEVILSPGSWIFETPRKPGLDWPSDFGKYTRTTNTGVNMVRLPIRFLKINEDIAIWSAPLELFCEIYHNHYCPTKFPSL